MFQFGAQSRDPLVGLLLHITVHSAKQCSNGYVENRGKRESVPK
jgi:hypothetical protein